MAMFSFTSVLGPAYKDELERLLFFNQNQDKAREDLPRLIRKYGMAHVNVVGDRLRILLDASPVPQALYVLDQPEAGQRLVGVTVYLREQDTLSLVIVAVAEDCAGARPDGEPPLVKQMLDAMCDIARQINGVTSVTLFPSTTHERQLPLD